MKKALILISLFFSSQLFAEKVKKEEKAKTNNQSHHIQLEKSAIDKLRQQKNAHNDKFASKYNYRHNGEIVVCESRNYQRAFCPADTRFGVNFLRQISQRSCDYNWGYDERGIWVDNGCRAEFRANVGWDSPDSYGNVFTCESRNYQRNFCPIRLDRRAVILVRQISNSSCHNNWGYDRNGVWVTNGCRAEFALDDRYDYGRNELTCSSINGQFRMCRADTRGGVEFVRQLSRSSCNYNWGYDQRGIWVANGCRAQFRVVPYNDYHDNYNNYQTRKVNCSSKHYARKVCRINRHNGVELIRQRSRSSCDGNWGFDRDHIWVTNGCRATFAVHEVQDGYGYDSYPNNDYGNNGYGNNRRDPYNNNGYGNNRNPYDNNYGYGRDNRGNSNYGRYGAETVFCESKGPYMTSCPIPYNSSVKMVRQLSRNSCQGNWGYNKKEIKVRNGCAAEFEVNRR